MFTILAGLLLQHLLLPSLTRPSVLEREVNDYWKRTANLHVKQLALERQQLRGEIRMAWARLPARPQLMDVDEQDLATEGTYGRLPEVRVDQRHGAIFPQPIHPPMEYSWWDVNQRAEELLRLLSRVRDSHRFWLQRIEETRGTWYEIVTRSSDLARRVRYLRAWEPLLEKHPESHINLLPRSLRSITEQELRDLREQLRPHRVLSRPFLKNVEPRSEIAIPIVTDVTDRRFLAEMEGALDTYWNQSPWARAKQYRFRIQWIPTEFDQAFAEKRISLIQHILRFPKEKAGMTTGGLGTYVHGSVLVLGPSPLDERTLAHEIGHLLGFEDCYARSLAGVGWKGEAVLEWTNPFYPDELLCDNTVGVARVVSW